MTVKLYPVCWSPEGSILAACVIVCGDVHVFAETMSENTKNDNGHCSKIECISNHLDFFKN